MKTVSNPQLRSIKLRLYPTVEQRRMLDQYFGASRWVWNRCLEYRSKAYQRRGESVTGVDFSRLLTHLKKTARYSWLTQMPATTLSQKLRDQDKAFANFFANCAKYPRFKKRGFAASIRFQLDQRSAGYPAAWENGKLSVPKLGTLKYRGNNHSGQMPKMVTIRRDACGHYYASFMVESVIQPKGITGKAVGLDFGIKHLATLNTGEQKENPKHLTKNIRRLAHRQRTLSRRVRGSNRYEAARQQVARLHNRIRDSRLDAAHKLTTALINENQVICVEDLNIRGMSRNRRLARSIAEVGWGEIRRQLEYKADWYERTLIVIDQWYPSTKTCSACHHKLDELDLSIRQWVCPKCGVEHDRDQNAAVNILNEGLKQLEPAGSRGWRVEGNGAGLSVTASETSPGETRTVQVTKIAVWNSGEVT